MGSTIFVYTFKGTDDALEAGLATKTHFDVLEGRLKNYNNWFVWLAFQPGDSGQEPRNVCDSLPRVVNFLFSWQNGIPSKSKKRTS